MLLLSEVKFYLLRKGIILAVVFLLVVFIAEIKLNKTHTYSAGAPSGYTGSPYDALSCATVGCHPGIPQLAGDWIKTNIPQEGFYPDSIYTITLTASKSGASNFGFQICALSAYSEFSGTWLLDDPLQTQFGYAYRYVNHTVAGLTGTAGKKTWTIKWKAPANDFDVTFYAAFVAGNGNQNQDITYLSDAWVTSISYGLKNSDFEDKLKIHPNPVRDKMKMSFLLSFPQVINFTVFSISGNKIDSWSEKAVSSGLVFFYRDFSKYKEGTYIISINSLELLVNKKIIVIK